MVVFNLTIAQHRTVSNMARCLLFCLFFPFFAKAQLFSKSDLIRFEQEAKRVTIIRDNWGVPHIYGISDADAVFGLMYVECEEDFKRVERNYLEVLGRLAEVDGIKSLSSDLQMRLIEDSTDAIADYKKCPAWFRRLLDAFADGVNYWLSKHPQASPDVLKRFEPWFALMFTDGSVSATRNGGLRLSEISDFYGPDKNKASVSFERIPVLEETGSNAIALSPTKTVSKNTLLYINPHVPFYFRTEVQMVSQEGLNVYGAVTWGQFFVYQGFNAHCGWMHTTSYADVADLYEEKVKKEDSTFFYFYDGQWKPVRTKPLQVRYLNQGALQTFQFTAKYTLHGPVMASRNNKWLSLKEYNRSLTALIEAWAITKAKSLVEFRTGMEMLSNTTNNTMYADDQGNIAYWHGNFIPKRNIGFDYTLPLDGTISSTNWKGIHSLNEIVHIYNPLSGWIENCNSSPFTASGTSSPERQSYPSYMAPDGQNPRSINLMRLLGSSKDFNLDQLIKTGFDHYLGAFDILLPPLFQAYGRLNPQDSLYRSLKDPIDILKQWDRYCSTSSVATTLATAWGAKIAQRLPEAKTIEEASDGIGRLKKMDSITSGEQKLELLNEAVKALEGKYGTWQKPWGEINRFQRNTGAIQETFEDSLPSLPVGMTSSRWGCLPAFESGALSTKMRYGYSGNSFIAAIEFGKRVRAKSVVTGGQSNQPSSIHFNDQAALFIDGKFKDVLFYKEDVMQHVEKIYHPGD
jgi:acyl-homoserine-lactone acylase